MDRANVDVRIWTVDEIKGLLGRTDKTGDLMVCKSLVQLYTRQTSAEQCSKSTKEHNNIGFNGVDAPILSSMADWYKQKGWLSPKQTAIARKKLIKYARQITELANEHELDKAGIRE